MTDNTRYWDKLGKTDPTHTKAFKRGGGFTGTAIKPMWSYKRMTEEFGPCGEGWGVGEPSFQVVPGENKEVLVYCTASIWYTDPSNVVYGVGGDKVVTYIKANEQFKRPERWESDDEAFKKAYTDAITNALKMIGVGADVHMGMFDDNKYVNSVANEFAEEAKEKSRKPAPKPAEPDPKVESLYAELSAITKMVGLTSFWKDNNAVIKAMSKEDFDRFTALKDKKKTELDFELQNLSAG